MKKLALVIGMCLTFNSCFGVEKMAVEKANTNKTAPKLAQGVEKADTNTDKTAPKLAQSVEKHAILSITDCIQLALQNSPQIKKARYNYGLAKGNLGVAKSGYFPTIGVGTGYNIN